MSSHPPKLIFKPHTEEEIEVFYEWMCKDQTFRINLGGYGETAPPETMDEYKKASKRWVLPTAAHLDEPSETFVGMAYLRRFNFDLARCRNYQLALAVLPPYWNTGIGTALTRHLVETAWDTLEDLNNLSLMHRTWNPAAEKIYSKCGFRECGRVRQSFYHEGVWYDRAEMEMTREDWGAFKAQNKLAGLGE